MSFLFPLFLVAGLSLAIPILIHLFNLRRYKTVFFPHTRFLRSIQTQSRRASEVQRRLLLALRLLFLAALVLAFAQPFWSARTTASKAPALQVVFIDNSPSTALKSGARTGLERSKAAARRLILSAAPDARFLVLSADRPATYEPLPAEAAAAAVDAIGPSPLAPSSDAVLATVQAVRETEATGGDAELWYFSDFQRGGFNPQPGEAARRSIRFQGVPVQAAAPTNAWIDTAFLLSPVLGAGGEESRIVVRTRRQPPGGQPGGSGEAPILQLAIDGTVSSAATPVFNAEGRGLDTLSFSTATAGWRRLALTLADGALPFDDTFRIAARSAPQLSVLVLSEGPPNPYVQAGLRAYRGFRAETRDVGSAPPDFSAYNLVVLSGITSLPQGVGTALGTALQRGAGVAVFPGRTSNTEGLSAALRYLAPDIRVDGTDTAAQAATTLQRGADLVRDLFETVPPNVQLPTARWHYRLRGGLGSGAQSILSFRSGDPLLAQYSPGRGALYVLSTGADEASGNFQGSYFFVPMLYGMAAHARGGDVYALTAGRGEAAFLPLATADERRTVHLYGPGGLDAVPPQRAAGAGLQVFVDVAVQTPGFYRLAPAGAAAAADSAVVALNADRAGSALDFYTPAELRRAAPWAKWYDEPAALADATPGARRAPLPLWKVCAILALAAVLAETIVLLPRRRRGAKAAPAGITA